MRVATVSAVGTLLAVLSTACGGFAEQVEPEPVYIGADLELTGDGSALGKVFHDALQLRVEQINQQRLFGDRRVELLVRDNRTDAATAAANLEELTANPDVTAIITGGCGVCTLTAVDVINDAGVPTISLAPGSGLVEPIDERSHLFQLAPTAPDTARVLASEIAREGGTTVAVLSSAGAYGDEGQDQMEAAARRAGLEVVVAESLSNDDQEVDSAVSSVIGYEPPPAEAPATPPGFPPTENEDPQIGPDAVVFWMNDTLANRLAVGLREAGSSAQFYLDASAANELFLAGDAAAALDGARLIFTETLVIDNVIASSPAKAARKNWFNDYLARQGTYHGYASFAADALQVILEAVQRAGTTDREAVRAAVGNVQIEGLSGPIRLRLENHSGLSPQALSVLVARGDRWQPAAG